MKKSLFIMFLLSLVAGTVTISCKSNTDKDVEAGVTEALHEAKQDRILDDQIIENEKMEWNDFKNATAAKIKANEALISDLRQQVKKTNRRYDAAYLDNIAIIEKRNADLLFKINNYKEDKDDWENFKTDFNRDMDELNKSLDSLNMKNGK
jgi:hypothetical protein